MWLLFNLWIPQKLRGYDCFNHTLFYWQFPNPHRKATGKPCGHDTKPLPNHSRQPHDASALMPSPCHDARPCRFGLWLGQPYQPLPQARLVPLVSIAGMMPSLCLSLVSQYQLPAKPMPTIHDNHTIPAHWCQADACHWSVSTSQARGGHDKKRYSLYTGHRAPSRS